jgi:hypothetical protein
VTPPDTLSEEQREQVWEQIERLEKSAVFHRSKRATEILHLVLKNDLDGKSVSEREIGIAVFGLSSDWDPKIDPIVRIAASRLRAKLQEYYGDAGREDPVLIEIPRGGYASRVVFRQAPGVENRGLPPSGGLAAGSQTLVPGVPTEQARKTKQARNWVGLSLRFTVSALALTLLVLVALIVRHRTQADQADNFAVRPFANDKTLQSSPAISPDGTTVAYVRYSGDGTSQIMLRTLDGTRTRSLTQGKVLDLNPSWSPNGESIAFLRVQGEAAEIVVETIANRTEREIAWIDASERGDWVYDSGPQLDNFGPVWDHTGTSLFVVDAVPERHSLAVFRIDLATGVGEQITHPPNASEDYLPRVYCEPCGFSGWAMASDDFGGRRPERY